LDVTQQLYLLHSEKLAHRDIKSDNVLIFEKNNRLYAKLCDYGTSKGIDHKKTITSGTFVYMPPELRTKSYTDSDEYLCSADIWSFGMVICETFYDFLFLEKFQIVNESSPIDRIHQVLSLIFNEKKVSNSIKELIEECVIIEREKRPNKMDDFLYNKIKTVVERVQIQVKLK